MLSRPSPGVILGRLVGHLTEEVSRGLNLESEKFLVSTRRNLIFCDWYEMTGYDSGARIASTEWVERHRASLERFHILFRSKLVSMGVAVANIATGGILQPTSNLAVFENELLKQITK